MSKKVNYLFAGCGAVTLLIIGIVIAAFFVFTNSLSETEDEYPFDRGSVEAKLGFSMPDDVQRFTDIENNNVYIIDFHSDISEDKLITFFSEAVSDAGFEIKKDWDDPSGLGLSQNAIYNKDGNALNIAIREDDGMRGIAIQLETNN